MGRTYLRQAPLVVAALAILAHKPTSSLVGVGFPFPARLAMKLLAIIVSAADTQSRLQRPIAERRHDCSDSTQTSGIDDVTPAALDEETL